jgi:hypothetical protein
LLSLPATFGALYFAVWVGHKIKASQTHNDIKDIKKVYIEDTKCGFWVAQLLSAEATAKKAPKGLFRLLFSFREILPTNWLIGLTL